MVLRAMLWLTTAVLVAALPGSAGVTLSQPGIPGEAESGAPEPCLAGQFACRDDGRCIPAAWRCDSRPHCADGSDEIDCSWNATCGTGQFRCSVSGRCIPAAWRCDGDRDCGPRDHSDEEPRLCEKDFKCPGNWARCATPYGGQWTCVPVQRFCDGSPQCIDRSDEWDICDHFNQSKCADLKCKVGCRPTHEGLACYCEPGFEPSDGDCVDTDECLVEGSCGSQLCTNTAGSYTCGCAPGYRETTRLGSLACHGINEPPERATRLVVVTASDVRIVDTRGKGTGTCSVPALNVRAMDYHYTNNSVCYIHHNISKSAIVCVDADDFSARSVLPTPAMFPDVTSVSHLAIDWVSSNWYLVDAVRGTMYVCSEDLLSCRRLLESLNKLRGLALDPTRGYMYWTAWGATAPALTRATLAGAARTALAQHALVYPGAVAAALPAQAVYWTDTYRESVERLGARGERHALLQGYVSQNLQSIDVFEDRVYLPVWSNSSVAVALNYGRGSSVDELRLDSRPTAVRVFHRQKQPLVSHPCGHERGGCAHICVTSYREGKPHAECLCRHGFRLAGHKDCVRAELESYLVVARGSPPLVQAVSLDPARAHWEPLAPLADVARPTALDVHLAARTLYYADVHRYEIARHKLEGGAREVFVGADVDNCEGLAVDWMGGNLYWTDDALGAVSVARLDAPGVRRVLVRERDYNPRAIALDPANGMMYWSVWAGGAGSRARIEAADMSGAQRRALVTDELHWPNGLVLDYSAQLLYWCDTYLNKIERLDLATGQRRRVLTDGPDTPVRKPYGLAVYDGSVYWSEHGTGVIRRLQNATSVSVLRELPPPLYDLKLVTVTQGAGRNQCSDKNGGCAELCLATAGGRVCACADGRAPRRDDVTRCDVAADLRNNTCADTQFHCKQGRCVDAALVCDGDADCADGDDEDAAPGGPCANVTCGVEQFKCDNRCYPTSWVCDGYKDCLDGTDESARACAQAACAPAQFQCAVSKRCVPAAWRCDAQHDCGPHDTSDEQDCKKQECGGMMFACGSGACVPWEYYCDGHADCADAADERACHRPDVHENRHQQHHNQHESDKNGLCEEHEFQCNNAECIRMEFRCDSRVDCLDGSDEAACNVTRTTTTTVPPPPPDACPPPALACDAGARCVPLDRLCDGQQDCDDGKDESDRCGEPMCVLAACSHTCHPSPSGPICSCPAGHRLQDDGATCTKVKPCAQWGLCSQICEPYKSRHKCTCYDGYKLADDGFTCKSTLSATPLLVFSNRHEIRGVELTAGGAGGGSRALVSSLKNTVALDWGSDEAGAVRLYWTDVVDDNIYRGTLVGGALSGIEAVVQAGLSSAEGLAVDWVARNLYWVESSLHQIEVARVDGRHRRTLLAGDMDSPRAIAADPTQGYLFWSDWEQGAPRIERCSLAGRRRTRVVNVDVLTHGGWPNGLTLDHLAQRLYWIDARSDSIHTTTYSGAEYHEVLRGHAALSHPFAITVFESRVYWTDWRSNSVVRADKFNGSDVRVVQRTLTQPFDIKVIHPSRQPPAKHNPCGIDNGNCSHLCLIDSPTERVCACPHVMRLTADGRTCEVHEKVLLIGRAGEIRGVDLEAPRVHTIPTLSGPQLAAPHTLHFLADTYTLYWADTETNEIKLSGLTRGPIRTLFDTGVENPLGFALDWVSRLVYYTSSRALGDRLQVATLRGEYSAAVFTERDGLHNVTSLALHPIQGKLFWAHSPGGAERIEMSNCDGSGRRVIADREHVAGVTSLVVDLASERVYWVSVAAASIQYIDLATFAVHTLPLALGARPTALEVYAGEVYWADGEDGSLRACDKDHCDLPRTLLNSTEGVTSLRVYDAAVQRGAGRGACALRRSVCAHLCLPVSPTDSVCRCATGYTRRGATCAPVDEVLVYSLSWELRGVALNTADTGDEPVLPPIAQLHMAAAIDYHAAGSWLYWADSEGGCVWRVRRDGTGRALVVQQQEPPDAPPADWLSGLALDWLAGNLYWSDPRRGLVHVATLNGSHTYVLCETDKAAVTALAVDPVAGWLFLSGGGWIQRARLDGSRRELLYNGTAVADIALDTTGGLVYWADSWDVSVSRMRYDGSQHETLLKGDPLSHPVALAFHADHLYWLDTMLQRGSIVSAPVANMTDYRVLKDNLGASLKDLLVWSSAAQSAPPASPAAPHNPCGVDNGGCAELCLFDGAAARCKCPHGDLTDDGKTCKPYTTFLMFSRITKIDSIHLLDLKELNSPYPSIQNKELMRNAIGLTYDYNASRLFYSDIQRGSINTVHFDGSQHYVLLEQVGAVEGLVYEPATETLFWTCTSEAAVRRAHVPDLDAARGGAGRGERRAHVTTVLRLPDGDRPRGIDVDPCDNRVYWTNWNASHPSIQRAYTNGYRLQTIISTHILMPNGLALDHEARKLYWADARLDKIERCHYDGSHRYIVTTTGTSHPFAVAAWRGQLFWTDWVSHAVWRSDQAGESVPVHTNVPRPMAIVAVAPVHRCASDPCSVLNGGCAGACSLDHTGQPVCSCRDGLELSPDRRTCRPAAPAPPCPGEQFACAEGGCIPADLLCDGISHCSEGADSSDEDLYYCTSRVCPRDSVQCGAGGRCVAAAALCDGRADCDDGADERDCPCQGTDFACASGKCIDISGRCDGLEQCEDGSDELDCPNDKCATLGPRALACETPPSCYLPEWRCDNKTDCPDGSDEARCAAEWSSGEWSVESAEPPSCSPDQFQCNSTSPPGAAPLALIGIVCVPAAWRCDGRSDCPDGSDEADHCQEESTAATAACAPDEFHCSESNTCVWSSRECDGAADCPAGEDEARCGCAPDATRCSDTGDCLDKSLYCDGDADCADGSDEPPGCARPSPTPPELSPLPLPLPSPRSPLCANEPGTLYCSGRCLSTELVCDGRDHCMDGLGGGAGTDEDPAICASSFVRSFHARGGAVSGVVSLRCGPGLWRCGSGACVPRSALCDTRDHCGDYSDEMFCGINECQVENGGCAHNCTDLPVGHTCWCRAGWRRGEAGGGAHCRDVDECSEDKPCAHVCRNTVGSFVCSCHEGYRLMPDGVSCSPISTVKPTLIFTNRYYIRRSTMSTRTERNTLLVHNLTNAVALDFDWAGGCVYWSDVTRHVSFIKRLCGLDPEQHLLLQRPGQLPQLRDQRYQVLHSATLQNPDGLAVDWVAGNVYWCDKGTDTIEVSRLDGRHRRVLVSSGLQEPRALATHPHRGALYWSDWGTSPHIGRAGMDGSSPRVLISSGLGWPNALTVAHATSELYFADAREDYIAVADLDGNHVRVLFNREHSSWLRLHHVFAIAEWEGRLYWSDWETRGVESCRRRPLQPHQYNRLHKKHINDTEWETSVGGAWECGTVSHTVHKPMDLRVYHPARQPPVPELSSLCASLNCSGLCLLSPPPPAPPDAPASAHCACPEHWVLQEDGRSCAPNCSAAHFVCATVLKCIPFWWRCDTQDDCGDGSDEGGACPAFRCAPGQFQCAAGAAGDAAGGERVCLHPAHICDGERQCPAGDDELHCDKFTCLSGQFKCAGNATGGGARCLPAAKRCDGVRDCHDGADEHQCPPRTCPPHHFSCANGACVSLVWTCDGDSDCGDGSDEGAWCAARRCPRQHHRCAGGRCVPRHWLCDGQADCPAAEDEAGCEARSEAGCEPTYFRCEDGRCIPGRWRCDYEEDCAGGAGEDERDCAPRNCSETEHRCESGECVRLGGACPGGGNVTRGAGGGGGGGDAGSCAPGTRPCLNNDYCILDEWWCDGEADCGDGSDESAAACGAPVPVPPALSPCAAGGGGGGGWRCGAGGCLPPAWRCDGKPDCGAAADEAPELCRHTACVPGMIRCSDHTCVPPSVACDGVADCAGGEDERHQLCDRLGVNSNLCSEEERLCADARCVPEDEPCDTGAATCSWRSCSQLCLQRNNHNVTCKCASGYRQRHAADGNVVCEIMGPKPQLLVGVERAVLAWDLLKHEHDARTLHEHAPTDRVLVSGVAGGLVQGGWTVWWADEAHGDIYRADAVHALSPGAPLAPLLAAQSTVIVRGAGAVRALRVEWGSGRVYWSARRGARGGVYSAALGGGRQVTHYEHPDAYPDDLVLFNETREMFWSDRGARAGVLRASLSGSSVTYVVQRGVRRGGALALDPPARRLYFVDTYRDVLESVALDGSGRALVARFGARGGRDKRYNLTAAEVPGGPVSVASGPCARLALWDDTLYCGTRHGLVRINKRRLGPAQYSRGAAILALDAVHPLLYAQEWSPCAPLEGAPRCGAGAVCVLSSDSSEGYACVCVDGLQPDHSQGSLRCLAPPPAEGVPPRPAPNASCSLQCGGGGVCYTSGAGTPACRCSELFVGPRCETYRCGDYCSKNSVCGVDAEGARGEDGYLPLKCTCHRGYSGSRCEVPPPAPAADSCARCENGGECRRRGGAARCACQPGYEGATCAVCAGVPACPEPRVCRRHHAGHSCELPRPDCADYCLNQGTCRVSTDERPRCECGPQWRGARCELPAPPAHPAPPPNNTTEHGAEGCVGGATCVHGGRCVASAAGGVCVCAGGWGGARCQHYVGRDHACDARACTAPALCAWRPTVDAGEAGTPFCVCPLDAVCAGAGAGAGAGQGAGQGARWGAGAAVGVLLLAVLAALYVVHRRRHSFVHARLADNVEISNPMYLAGADDVPLDHRHANGGNHFANPVYESMYAPPHRPEEHDNLLTDGGESPAPPERTALL